jgi:hypothetical protein
MAPVQGELLEMVEATRSNTCVAHSPVLPSSFPPKALAGYIYCMLRAHVIMITAYTPSWTVLNAIMHAFTTLQLSPAAFRRALPSVARGCSLSGSLISGWSSLYAPVAWARDVFTSDPVPVTHVQARVTSYSRDNYLPSPAVATPLLRT